MGKQTVHNFNLCVGDGEKMAFGDIETICIGQGLSLHLPKLEAVAVASRSVGANEQLERAGVDFGPYRHPSAANAFYSKCCWRSE